MIDAGDRETLVGQTTGGLEILCRLPRNGPADYYLSRHIELGVHRVMAVVPEPRETEDSLFQREAPRLTQITHPLLARWVDFGRLPDDRPYLCREHVMGLRLDDYVSEHGAVGSAQALVVLLQVAEALACLHERGIVHGNLGPAAVMLRDGDPAHTVVVDFGVRILVAGREHEPIGPATDVHAFADLGYALLRGEQTPVPTFEKRDDTTPRSNRPARIPGFLARLFFACQAHDPADRPTADEVLAHLRRESDGIPLPVAARDVSGRAYLDLGERVLAHGDGVPSIASSIANQIVAVVVDIGRSLEATDRAIQGLLDELDGLEEVIESLQIESALAADGGDLFDPRLDTLIRRRRMRLSALIDAVVQARPHGPSSVDELFVELDERLAHLAAAEVPTDQIRPAASGEVQTRVRGLNPGSGERPL